MNLQRAIQKPIIATENPQILQGQEHNPSAPGNSCDSLQVDLEQRVLQNNTLCPQSRATTFTGSRSSKIRSFVTNVINDIGCAYRARQVFMQDLQQWVNSGGTRANQTNRQIAANKMKIAYTFYGKTLDLSNLNLTSLPEAIGTIKSLQVLTLSNNLLTSLPESIENLSNLKLLTLLLNRFTTFPHVIEKLSSLLVLRFNGNKLTSLSLGIGNLSNLRELSLDMNKLTSLPEELCNLSNLRVLSASGNKLKTLPEGIGKLTKLQDVCFNDNQLKALPNSIGKLSKLHNLLVEDNELKAIPRSVGSLSRLKTLWINGNHLTDLPNEIGNLNNLQIFSVSNNQLTTLPNSLGKCQKLKYFYCGRNNLISLSRSLGACRNLCNISDFDPVQIVHLNNFTDQIAEILQVCKTGNYLNWIIEKANQPDEDALDLSCISAEKLPRILDTRIFNSPKLQQNLQTLHLPSMLFDTPLTSVRNLKNIKRISFT